MEPPDQLKVMAATSLVISTHFSLAEEYLDAAGLQNGRIWLDPPPEWDPGNWVELTRELSDAAAMMAPGDSIPMPHFDYGNIAERQSRFQAILIEVHLYFVLIDHVYKYLDAVVSADRYHELRVRLDELNDKWFRNYNAGRNLFEHRISRLVALGESGQPWHHELSLDHGYL
ncbi:MAG: hypothetical protein IH872_13780, partial [Chloroflexi bacterium]|nr:hypothetical protein [Chloroflexota bacterium]